MTAIVCYARCWGCQFGSHLGGVHTWMDEEDIGFSKTATRPGNPHGWKQLGTTHPCACWCVTTAPCTACQGSGEHPDDQLRECDGCAGRGHPDDVVVSMRPPTNLAIGHGPAAVRRDLDGRRPAGLWTRRAMRDCPGCRDWLARRARVSALRRAYRLKGHR